MYFSLVVTAALALAALILSLVPARWRFLLWVAVIAGCVVPWIGWQDHAHWAGVNWVPFSSAIAPVKLSDVLINIILYLPFGFLLVRHHAPGRLGLPAAVAGACLLSLLTEWAQVFSHGRFPTMTDVATNTLGGLLGALAARRFGRRRAG